MINARRPEQHRRWKHIRLRAPRPQAHISNHRLLRRRRPFVLAAVGEHRDTGRQQIVRTDVEVRLHIDGGRPHVLACRAVDFVPDDADGTAALNGDAIVELKFLGQAPAMFREIVEVFAIEPLTISKYRLSIEALARAGDFPTPVPTVPKASNVVDA